MEKIGDSKYVLLGEATHGTHEYYTWRAEISKRLIKEKGFSFVAVEGDWPDCFKINRWIKDLPDTPHNISEVLKEFQPLANLDVGQLGNCRFCRMVEKPQQKSRIQRKKSDFMVWTYIAFGNPWKPSSIP